MTTLNVSPDERTVAAHLLRFYADMADARGLPEEPTKAMRHLADELESPNLTGLLGEVRDFLLASTLLADYASTIARFALALNEAMRTAPKSEGTQA